MIGVYLNNAFLMMNDFMQQSLAHNEMFTLHCLFFFFFYLDAACASQSLHTDTQFFKYFSGSLLNSLKVLV